MEFRQTDTNHYIGSVSRKGSLGDYYLTWKAVGIENFLIIQGISREKVVIKGDEEIIKIIESNMEQLEEQGRLEISEAKLSMYLANFSELKRNGGFRVKEKPGIYAVYGIDLDNHVIYTPESGNIFQLKIDIEIKCTPVMREKGLIKKKLEYSGYQEIQIVKGVKFIEPNSIFYTISENDYKYSVPNEVIREGEKFFVQCPRECKIEFYTNHRNGINIKEN